MEAVAQFYHQYPNITGHGDNHFTNSFGLRSLPVGNFVEFSYPINQEGDFFPKIGSQLL